MLASVCAAYVEVNDYADAELPLLRERMQLILTEPPSWPTPSCASPTSTASSRGTWRRGPAPPRDLVPRLVAATTRAAATTAFEAWLADERSSLGRHLHLAFDEIADGLPQPARLTAAVRSTGRRRRSTGVRR